ncbi:hypothetical protein EVG20_g8989 [Dentipellis fragilis]|uniref:Uncharacterized protein n=1 Tax=Dentipellis fragilis TaxID=205917 RepID=A0A4Y9Y626_9AGAM|nr:hypothetical protein EVG20_g8989 [Dentipellis fragilis]
MSSHSGRLRALHAVACATCHPRRPRTHRRGSPAAAHVHATQPPRAAPLFGKPAFAALHIDMLCSDVNEGIYLEEDFADPDVPLEALTIRSASEQDVGLVPGFSFADRTYPRLAVPSVKSSMFDATAGVEELIVRHAGTLRRLVAEYCMIGIEEGEDGGMACVASNCGCGRGEAGAKGPGETN